ncbi:MAG: hypothetical protein ABIP75_10875 [Pyrinomonadaceae bacterium]
MLRLKIVLIALTMIAGFLLTTSPAGSLVSAQDPAAAKPPGSLAFDEITGYKQWARVNQRAIIVLTSIDMSTLLNSADLGG